MLSYLQVLISSNGQNDDLYMSSLNLSTTYSHYVGNISDQKFHEAKFNILSYEMMVEFRSTGALFAKYFIVSNELLLTQWKKLIIQKYSNKETILQLCDRSILIDDNGYLSPSKKRKQESQVAIVINSNINYKVALSHLLNSILNRYVKCDSFIL